MGGAGDEAGLQLAVHQQAFTERHDAAQHVSLAELIDGINTRRHR